MLGEHFGVFKLSKKWNQWPRWAAGDQDGHSPEREGIHRSRESGTRRSAGSVIGKDENAMRMSAEN
jgi:hypothetical protein